MNNIRALLKLPKFIDPDQDHAARLLNRLVWLTFGTFAVIWVFVLLFDPLDADRASRSFIIPATLSIVTVVLLHRRHLGAASLIFVAQFWLVITAAALSGGGMATPAVAGFPLVALAAGLVRGWRAGLLSSLVCVTTMIALTYLESNHLLPPFTASRTPLTYLIVDVLILCLIIVFVYFYTLQIKRTEEQLRILNTKLEQRVTERTLELEKANRAKDEFLANMSHELRSPLSAILGLSESLLEQRRGSLNENQQRSVQMIESSGQHLLELINDILDLSKIDAGKFDCYPEFISIDATCKSSLAFISGEATKKEISISYRNESGISTVYADPRRLKQILVNLLTNAVKFTPEKGNVSLGVTFDLENNLVQLSVSDDGIGISPANIEKLFQRFVQVDSQLNRRYEGTGLGLALVQRLTDLHGGSVRVESRIGKGSRFTISLPHAKESES